MSAIITHSYQRGQRFRADFAAPPYEAERRGMALLKRQLVAAQAKVARLTAQLQRQAAILQNRSFAVRSAAAFANKHLCLTSRERQVLLMFVEHPNDKEVASRLGTKVQTVRNQMRSIQRKLGVNSRAAVLVHVFRRRRGQPIS